MEGTKEEQKHQLWQELMDKAYDRWGKGGDLKDLEYLDFLDELEPLQRKAVVLGNLNYQVQNGGFSQWIGNRYWRTHRYLRRTLEQMPGPAAKAVLELIDPLLTKLTLVRVDPRQFSQMDQADEDRLMVWLHGPMDEFGLEDEEQGQQLDDKYYKLDDAFMDEVEAFLKAEKEKTT